MQLGSLGSMMHMYIMLKGQHLLFELMWPADHESLVAIQFLAVSADL